ncbi:MAG: hypothetical protein ACO331_09030 [Prochlorothrix sp.]
MPIDTHTFNELLKTFGQSEGLFPAVEKPSPTLHGVLEHRFSLPVFSPWTEWV